MVKDKKNAALGFILVTLLIDCIGFGIIIPVVPKLIQELSGGTLSDASKYGGWLSFAYAIMQFVCSPILGGLSDRYGRRPVLLISLLGLGIDYIFVSFAPTLGWLFLGRIIAGVCGASFTTASAYIADISTPEKRAQNFGMIGVAFGVGFIIGPVIGGVFSQYGIRIPFMVAAGLSLLNWLYGYFVLPESLSKDNRRAFDWKRANPIGSFLNLKKHPTLLSMISSLSLIYIAAHAVQSTWSFYTMEKFSWDSTMVGYSLGFVGLMVAFVQGGLIRVAIPKLGQKRAVFLGMGLYVTGFMLMAFATKSWMMFAFLVPYCLGGIAGPAIQGIISNQVKANEQGELQGIMASLMSATSIVGPVLMTNLFSYFTAKNAPVYFPGAPFFLGGLLTLASLLMIMPTIRAYHRKSLQPQEVEVSDNLGK